MQVETPASRFFGRTAGDIPKLLLKPYARLLQTQDPAATINRLFCSQHVADLRLIVAMALVAVYLVLILGLPLSLESALRQWPALSTGLHWKWAHIGSMMLASFLTFFTPTLAVLGAVLAWAYQAGSARLGIVDLFACEIGTLCRVLTVVDTVSRYVDRFGQGPRTDSTGVPQPRQYTSQEDYFPVYENNTKDLQSLEAKVVINITAFYTYMKAVRDSQRALADIAAHRVETEQASQQGALLGPQQDATRNLVYMLFLGLESARLAITDLVEFEPENAENTIVILLSELEAYRFLCSQFTDKQDPRHQRLALRACGYRQLVPKLCSLVESRRAAGRSADEATPAKLNGSSQWERALRLVPELQKKHKALVELLDASTIPVTPPNRDLAEQKNSTEEKPFR
jgi:hypothetical protein